MSCGGPKTRYPDRNGMGSSINAMGRNFNQMRNNFVEAPEERKENIPLPSEPKPPRPKTHHHDSIKSHELTTKIFSRRTLNNQLG